MLVVAPPVENPAKIPGEQPLAKPCRSFPFHLLFILNLSFLLFGVLLTVLLVHDIRRGTTVGGVVGGALRGSDPDPGGESHGVRAPAALGGPRTRALRPALQEVGHHLTFTLDADVPATHQVVVVLQQAVNFLCYLETGCK